MTIKTSTFGGVTLTGESAKVFKKQFLSAKAEFNPSAQKSLEEGRALRKQIQKQGYAIIHPNK